LFAEFPFATARANYGLITVATTTSVPGSARSGRLRRQTAVRHVSTYHCPSWRRWSSARCTRSRDTARRAQL